jgi:phosphomannomutase
MQNLRNEFPGVECDTLDGLTFRFPTWWFNVRQVPGSQTLRLNVEGRTSADERQGRQRVERIIRIQNGRRTQ